MCIRDRYMGELMLCLFENGIRLKPRDQETLKKGLIKDKNNNINYIDFYYKVKNMKSVLNDGEKDDLNIDQQRVVQVVPRSDKSSSLQKRSSKIYEGGNEKEIVLQKNIDLLKKRKFRNQKGKDTT
eukprot:TRINITY_DN16759_c0_g1_i1.p1 TRINITY_DN16759_c0_g1~~TRINITY_DN16759_c0_g1_i1.p1  ORF type:complete len:126 (+),score=18.59 TRINITY_DN16759_c0_g1_i1:65-442(+)